MRNNSRARLVALALAVLCAAGARRAYPGTPLVCQPFDIGDAASLPWGARGSWDAPNPAYDRTRVVGDTLALLDPGTAVIVRMETLRRAALYTGSEEHLVEELLAALRGRTADDRDALALFDYGYLIETYQQTSVVSQRASSVNDREGYAYIVRAIRLSRGSPEMHFAAAMVTIWPRRAEHAAHRIAAIKGASADPLLQRNLAAHLPYASRGQGMAY